MTVRPLFRRLALVLVVLVGLFLPSRVHAGGPGDGLPVVQSGREALIQGLVAPFLLQKEIAPGWTLAGISISATAIRYVVKGPSGAEAALRLEHPARAPSAERTASFTLFRDLTPESAGPAPEARVLDPLVAAVRANDAGGFWPAAIPAPSATELPQGMTPGPTSLNVEEKRPRWELTLRRKVLLGGLAAALLILLVDRRRLAPKR